ncbi:PhoH family protein [Syntrophobacter fumaroxidans MPOB]|uniref:PhoH-like protein n=1 Tax=Syntrophobacter fumaroxidans (strain DSM 10017 / MPOB) TaxID=335543 RepID=A0LK93_SYNFM|nr:PhoH family protein [Syntrophobacter fumaroxidans MPOB]
MRAALASTAHETEKQRGSTAQLSFDDNKLVQQLAGEQNNHLKLIEKQLDVRIHLRGNQFTISGDRPHVELSERLLFGLGELIQGGYPLYAGDIVYAIRILSENIQRSLKDIFLDHVFIASNRRVITPKSVKQKEYIEAIRHYDIVFGVGPAGTGKTYLAMAMAVAAMTKDLVRRIVLVRPAVEAGEKLGFLPGDLAEKVNPYLRPLYDALHDMMDFERATGLLQRGAIEVAPLAFMRGRTLNDAFVILDEAQNTTTEQMKMFLTRLGLGSKAVITGDITQIDLPENKPSGLIEAIDLLQGIQGIQMVFFSKKDVVRHRLVQEIIQAYEQVELRKAQGARTPSEK